MCSMRYVLLPNTSVALWRCVTPNVGKTRTTLFLPFLTHPSAHTKGCWCSGLMMLMIVGRMDWIWMAAAYWYCSWLLIVLIVDFVSSGTETWVGSGKSSLFAQAETNNLKLVDWLKALNKILRLNALSSLSHSDLSLCLSRRKKKLVWEWKRHNIPPEYFPMCPSAVKGCIIILPSSRVPSLLCVCVGLPRIDEPHLLCFYSSLCCSTQALKTIASLLFYYHCCSTYRLSGICCCFNIDQFSSGDKIQISRIKALFNILSLHWIFKLEIWGNLNVYE